jgi:rifampicin phosphotransferase
MDIAGLNVVVTGGSEGIGAHIAQRFAERGARVLIVARSADRLAQVAERIGATWIAADLLDPTQLDSLVDKCVSELGHIDVWVNNAGVSTEDAFVHLERERIRQVVRLNLEATALLTHDVLPHMIRRGRGHIVQMSSVSGAVPFPGLAAYGGTKAGVTHLTETLRIELEGTGVGLTVVAPGPVDTKMWDAIDDRDLTWPAPALKRFRRLFFLPKVDPAALATDIVEAVEKGRAHVRPKNRYQVYHVLNNLPRRLVRIAMAGVTMPPLHVGPGDTEGWTPLWPSDNAPSKRWTVYTRGNVGEVFPEVVLPLTWGSFGGAAERGWRKAFSDLGLLMRGDLDPAEDFSILGVFGGYCYINASYVRLLGVRAPGGTVEAIDKTFFGESAAPPYRRVPGDTNRRSSLRLGRTILSLLRATDVPGLDDDKADVAHYLSRFPGSEASDDALLGYIEELEHLFERLFARHIVNTFSVALVSGALADLCAKAGHADKLVAILGGIGDVESAAPSAAMWQLAASATADPAVAEAFDDGVHGLVDRLVQIPGSESWRSEFQQFLDEFGSRGPNEWDFGADPWEFRPELALAAIDRMRGADPGHEPRAQAARLAAARHAAVDEVRRSLNAIDRFQFDRALRATTLYSQARERSKTTVIAAVHGGRRAQQVLAVRIAERGGPTVRWHTCLLRPDEFRHAVSDPRPYLAQIAERVTLYETLSALEPPFVFDGTIPDVDDWQRRDHHETTVTVNESLQGIAGCPGVARGRARVVLDAGEPGDLGPGDVLIAPITDPSWTPLFLAADAVVVDVGATMSHAVIVSRELGIPCVVSAVGATKRIPDGALVEVDGNTGTVTIIELP